MRVWHWALALLGLWVAMPAAAQVATPPVHQAIDGNGVDMVKGTFNTSMSDVSIGPAGPHGLAFVRAWYGSGWWNSISAGISGSTTEATVTLGNTSESFHWVYPQYVSDAGDGATLSCPSGTWTCTYTTSNGIVAQFSAGFLNGYPTLSQVSSITYPDGTLWKYDYHYANYCDAYTYPQGPSGPAACIHSAEGARLNSVANSFGYQLHFDYAGQTFDATNAATWSQVSRVTAINTAVEACGADATSCSLVNAWPHADYVGGIGYPTAMTDPNGQTWHYSYSGANLTGIMRPGASGNDVTIGYSGTQVTSLSKAGVNFTYGYVSDGTNMTVTRTDSAAQTHRVVSSLSVGLMADVYDALNKHTHYDYDSSDRLTKVTAPENNAVSYTYDSRGNIVQTQLSDKAASSTIASYASFDATCTNPKTCNQPNNTTDARGNITSYAYDASSGLPTSVTKPAPGGGVTVQPQTRTSYTTVTSSYDSAALYLPSVVSTCGTTASCAGGADETRTVISYNGASGNYLPSSVAKGAGDGTLTATSSLGYDAVRNVTSTTDPLGYVTYAAYTPTRQQLWVMTPDPDGAGPLKNRLTYVVYNGDGTPQSVLQGSANPDSSGFTVLQSIAYSYDSYGRKLSETLVVGSTNYSQAAYSYDALGRINCTAQRMNMASINLDACSSGTPGADGPDRISQTHYDAVGRIAYVQDGIGVSSLTRTVVAYSYTDNGKVSTLTDAKGNVTSYTYDGFDRSKRTCYNAALTTCQGTPSDYDELNYSNTAGSTLGLMTTRRLRDGNTLSYIYDNLARVTRMTPTALTGNDVPLVYAYDNLDHLTQTIDTANGHNTSFVFDALGRETVETGPWRGKSMGYDLAGRMTSLDYGDGFHVIYSYDNVGEMTGVSENGATLLASYGYDDLGNRTSIFNRPNGVVTSYGYDGASRLTSLTNDLAGTASDLTIGLSYNAAGQISQRTSSNDAYAWTDGYNVNRGYATNGLNQYTSITSSGTITPTYDGRGNTTGAGGLTYGYTALNQLQSVSSGAWFYHDAAGRLDMDVGTSTGCALLDNVGSVIDAELDCSSGATLRRYVYGADNAPLVWYEGSGTSDRRWLTTDERGSVIAVTDGSGNAMRINSYDEYGIPGANNLGRFGYTGQAWLPSIGMYYARARIYSPTLGRFMQTDPIGYGDGPNWYNYTHGDPVNGVDIEGLEDDIVVTGSRDGGIGGGGGSGSSGVAGPLSDNAFGRPLGCGNGVDCLTNLAKYWENKAKDAGEIVVTAIKKHPDYAIAAVTIGVGIGCPECLALEAIGEAAEGEEIVVTATKARGWFARLIDRVFGRSACFAAGTLVQTDHGLRAIETIRPGDMVLSRDEKTGRTAYKQVTAVKAPTRDELYQVEFDVPAETTAEHHAEIQATATHPWRTTDGRWISTSQLRRGMQLVRADGAPALVSEVRDTAHKAAAYNLTVQGFHTYFVGKDRVWVHNACDPTELHHITPKYLGGAKNGPLAAIPRSYHQQITNAFRRLWPYGSSPPSPEELARIMKEVYDNLPLP